MPIPDSFPAQPNTHTLPMTTVCKHPKVRIVAREEDAEYVECIDCGEVFDSHEYADIVQEESAESTLATEDEDA